MAFDLVESFKAVNILEDPQERINEWVRRADGILFTHVPEAGKQN